MATYSFWRDADMEKTPTEKMLDNAERSKKQLLMFLIGFFILQFIVWGWQQATATFVKGVDIQNMQIVGSSQLCPGDLLTFNYDLEIRGTGNLIKDFTVWRETPPKTMIFSTESKKFIVGEPVHQNLLEAWRIPPYYFNYETYSSEVLPPGTYRRYFSVSSPTNERIVDIDYVEFTIKDRKVCHAPSD